jgi:hypothetical protein
MAGPPGGHAGTSVTRRPCTFSAVKRQPFSATGSPGADRAQDAKHELPRNSDRSGQAAGRMSTA